MNVNDEIKEIYVFMSGTKKPNIMEMKLSTDIESTIVFIRLKENVMLIILHIKCHVNHLKLTYNNSLYNYKLVLYVVNKYERQ